MTKMSKSDAQRIQSAIDKQLAEGKTANTGFKERAMSAADKNAASEGKSE